MTITVADLEAAVSKTIDKVIQYGKVRFICGKKGREADIVVKLLFSFFD